MDLETLQANRASLMNEWAKRVARAKAEGLTHREFHTGGPVLAKDNTLWLYVVKHGVRVDDLKITPEGEIYEVTHQGQEVRVCA